MKKYLLIIAAVTFAAGCVGMSSTDGDSTKKWVEIVSSKADMEGDVFDVCYRLNLRFSPQEAANRIDTDKSCITRCCWFSENKTVELRFNDTFTDEFRANGKANRYEPESIKFYMRYSPFLNTIHAKAEPTSLLRSDGLVTLPYEEARDEERLLKIGGLEDFKAKNYDTVTQENTNDGEYLFRRTPEGQLKINKTQALKEKEAAEASVSASASAAAAGGIKEVDGDKDALLAKKLAYERQQAVLLLKRFYNKDIDAYIRSIDKAQKQKGLILLANDRSWATKKVGSPIYRVTCSVKGQLGKTKNDMKSYPIACGVYEVDLDDKTVKPVDSLAAGIASKEYK